MSGLDQPIVIANSCYHVGHERSFRAAEEQGYLKDEGLERYVYERGGLIPGQLEAEGLGQIMWERGVDVATAVDVRAAVVQRAHGEDVYIVGGWRTQLAPRLIGAKGLTGPADLRGARIVIREKWGLNHIGISGALRTFGIDPERDVEWVENPVVAYNNQEGVGDLLRSGQVSVLTINGRGADDLVSEGYPVVLDMERFFRERGAWPPGKVIVATGQTIEQRSADLGALLRANLRAFWFVQDPENHEYMHDLDTRMRLQTFNEDERRLRTPSPRSEGPGTMAMDGQVPRPALIALMDEMVQRGELDSAPDLDDVLKDAASIEAFDQLMSRGLIDAQKLQEWRRDRS